jgi:hypothetical protein
LLCPERVEPLALGKMLALQGLLLVQVSGGQLQALLRLAQLQRKIVRLLLALHERPLHIPVLCVSRT